MTTTQYRIEPDTLLTQISPGVSAMMGEHLVLLSIEHGAYFEMNPTAKLIWESLTKPRTIIELCELVHEEYEVSEHYCRESIEQFVLALKQENMVSFSKPNITKSYQAPL